MEANIIDISKVIGEIMACLISDSVESVTERFDVVEVEVVFRTWEC